MQGGKSVHLLLNWIQAELNACLQLIYIKDVEKSLSLVAVLCGSTVLCVPDLPLQALQCANLNITLFHQLLSLCLSLFLDPDVQRSNQRGRFLIDSITAGVCHKCSFLFIDGTVGCGNLNYFYVHPVLSQDVVQSVHSSSRGVSSLPRPPFPCGVRDSKVTDYKSIAP